MGEGGKWVGGSWEESEEGCIGLGEAGTLALLLFFFINGADLPISPSFENRRQVANPTKDS